MENLYQRQNPDRKCLFPGSVLLIFCKTPIPGQVKTRLTPSLTPEQAATVHRRLTLATLQLATDTSLCDVQLWCSPNTQHDFFNEAAQAYPVSLHRQQGADLGARMQHAICSALTDYQQAIIIGCDCPSLTTTVLQQALEALQKVEMVLAPAEDGGYALIGCSNPQPELFSDMAWGSREVLPLTRERIRKLKLTCQELAEHWDVDTIEDYRRYLQHLQTNGLTDELKQLP